MQVSFSVQSDDAAMRLLVLQEGCVPRASFTFEAGPVGFAAQVVLGPGRHRVVISNHHPGSGGRYAINVACNELRACSSDCVAGSMRCGEVFQGELSETDCRDGLLFIDTVDIDVDTPSTYRVWVSEEQPDLRLVVDLIDAGDCSFASSACTFNDGVFSNCRLEPGRYRFLIGTHYFNIAGKPNPFRYGISLEGAPCSGAQARRVPGDCNADGRLDIADAICELAHLFRGENARIRCGGEAGIGQEADAILDWNRDAVVDITDPVALLMYLFNGEAPHALGTGCVSVSGCESACGG